jgi:hypothetical protein
MRCGMEGKERQKSFQGHEVEKEYLYLRSYKVCAWLWLT